MAINLTKVKEAINAKYVTEIGDDDKVELLLQDDGNTFYDASFNKVDVVGDYAKLSATQAKWGTHSIEYTAGNGYIDLPTVDFAFGTGDFTVEFWMYGDRQDGNIINPISSTGAGYWAILIQTGKLRWNDAYASTNLLETTVDVTAASWKHFAFVRSSGTLTVYVDGTANASIADTSNYVNTDARIGNGNIGQLGDVYFDGIRVTKGKALYTNNFTAPTSQFTISSDLNLLNIRNKVQADENVLSYASINDFPEASPSNAGSILKTGNNYYISTGTTYDAFAVQDTALDQSPRWRYQGSNYGFTAGGFVGPLAPSWETSVDRFPFSADAHAISVGDLSVALRAEAGFSSQEDGFISASTLPGNPLGADDVHKFSMISTVNSAVIGKINNAVQDTQGFSDKYRGANNGYIAGGQISPYVSAIDKFSMVTPFTLATGHGNLVQINAFNCAITGNEYGYSVGGFSPANALLDTKVIESFPFANSSGGTQVGNLAAERFVGSGCSSETNGYHCAGRERLFPSPNVVHTDIETFTFSSSSLSVSNFGDLTTERAYSASHSSFENGYVSGGYTLLPGPVASQLSGIDKFSFSSAVPVTATSNANLTGSKRLGNGGHHY